jgi:antagonist of KipI
MSLSIIKPGLLDTIQDMGRYGFSNWGINSGGAMDRYAAHVANILVGNGPDEAVIEIHFPGPQILFEQNTMISITGADFSATLNDNLLPSWQPVVVRKNTVLHFPRLIRGARCYLAVHGGFCFAKWLNSYSTNLKAGAGGFFGRSLRKGDELSYKENSIYFAGLLKEDNPIRVLPWRADITKAYHHLHEIFILPGKEWDGLSPYSRESFLENNFIIHPSSDRMGYQLKGPDMEIEHQVELVSSGVNFGTIQLLPMGQLIVLMADHQTTGGYPRIGHVISAHLNKLAQLRPSEAIQFKLTDIQTAEKMLFDRRIDLQVLRQACSDHLNSLVC